MKRYLKKFQLIRRNALSPIRNLLKKDLYHQIASDDILSRQRYRLFCIYTVAGMIVSAGVLFENISLHLPYFLTAIVSLTFLMHCINYLSLQVHKQVRVAYWITVLVMFLSLHSLTYFSGGIKNSGMIYLGPIILCAFMLLGNKAGKVVFGLAFLHLAFFYYASTQTNLVSNILIGNGQNDIEQDFLITGVLGLFFLSAQSNNLESNKNIVIQKITESRNILAEQNYRLEESNRMLEKKIAELDKFASIVSHDLKAPLRAIGNLTGWIEEDAGESLIPEVRQSFNTIKGRVTRMESLINAILDYSKADRTKNNNVRINPKDFLEDIIEFNGKPENCSITIQNKMPDIVADKVKIQQVFSNLIQNAIKYNDKKKIEINITSTATKDGYEFSVADNGPGIEKKYHDKIFVIFQTLNRRDDVEGTGVGLAIVKKIVEEYGGKIWVESELGKGANFKFFWPRQGKEQNMTLIAA